jgi:general secretion pathway protein D
MPKPQIVTRFLASLVARRLAAALVGLILSGAAAAQATPAGDEKITVNFVNADIQSVIKTVGQHTGKNFILDPRVTGTVNIVSERPVSKDMLYQVLLSTLRVQGYAAVESEGFVKIVPEAEAKTSAAPMAELGRGPGDRVVTHVFVLQNESAVQLVPVLRPLVTANNFIAAYPNNNAIVIVDYASNVQRIQRIIQSVDRAGTSEVQIVTLQNASAIDIAQMLQRVVPETSAPPNAPGSLPKAAVAVDSRTNSLVVRAESALLMNRIKSLALGLDTPGAGNNNIYTVFLRNAEATRIADTLRGLMSGSESTRTTTTTTTPAGQTATQTTASTSVGGAAAAAAPAPSSVIQAYPPTNSIIITATEPVYRGLRTVIDALDQRRHQVYVEALIVEVSTGLAAEFGVQWNAGRVFDRDDAGNPIHTLFGGTNFSTTPGTNILSNALNPQNIGGGLNLGIIRGTLRIPGTTIDIANLQLLARALEGDSGANVLSTPNVLTLDNEEAKIVVGQNVPFITGSYTPIATSAANPFQTIERKDIGITLRVTPQVSEAGAVKLKIFQEVSSVTRDKALVQSADIITNKRSLESTVLVDSGQIVVLGGLIQDDQQASIDKVPLLGDIPYVGALFRYESRNRRRTNLMVFLRPVVLKDEKGAASITADRYEYIRNLQGEIRAPATPMLPGYEASQLPPFEDAKSRPLGAP